MPVTDPSPAQKLRDLLDQPGILVAPACYDALSARLIERGGFDVSFMSGFAVAASRLGMPDTGLISYGEMLEQGRNICNAVSIPVIGDADTGYGNALNVKRTIHGYAQAGFACAMIEDQLAPKRCGHTRGKLTVGRDEALGRIQAAVDARDEGADILIMARTDARATDGFDEAMWRIKAFADIGADILFLEAPENEQEMRDFCSGVPGPKMANLVEQGDTPLLPPAVLQEMGYKIVLYPLTMMTAALAAMETALASLKEGKTPDALADFSHLREVVGFDEYYEAEKKYADG
jgi:2-methylisocitrate lyase-like PEP mutase family enzyme